MSEEQTLRVELVGELGDLSSVIETGTISMAFATGHMNHGPPVLVPMMSCQIVGKFGRNDEAAAPSATLSYDNVAHLLMQFSSEYLEALDVFSAVAPGSLGAAVSRLNHSAEWLQIGSAQLHEAAQKLIDLSKQLEAARVTTEVSPKTVRKAPEKPASAKATSPAPKRRIRVIRPQ